MDDLATIETTDNVDATEAQLASNFSRIWGHFDLLAHTQPHYADRTALWGESIRETVGDEKIERYRSLGTVAKQVMDRRSGQIMVDNKGQFLNWEILQHSSTLSDSVTLKIDRTSLRQSEVGRRNKAPRVVSPRYS